MPHIKIKSHFAASVIMSISNSELQLKLESMEEQLTRQKQVLREATAKHQNLVRHLKLIEAESGRLMYDETTSVTQVHSMEDLQRLVDLVIAWTPLVYRARPSWHLYYAHQEGSLIHHKQM